MSNFGLYYPFIRVRDDAWLKTVALYWSRLGRLKPRHYRTTESPVARALGDETDFFLDIDPEGQGAVDVGRQFIHLIDNHAGELEEQYGIERPWGRHPGTAIADWESPAGDPLAYIHLAKLSEDLRDALGEAKLARPGRHHDADWVGIHPRLASVYMCALTREIALHQRLQPLTDQDSEHLAIAGSSVEEVALALLGSLKTKESSARPTPDLTNQ